MKVETVTLCRQAFVKRERSHHVTTALRHNKGAGVPLASRSQSSTHSPKLDVVQKPILTAGKRKMGSLLLGVAGGGLLGSGFDISGPESVAQALGVLAAVVAVHETGHFLAARSQGIHVSKFAVGFGPTLFRYQGKEVEYSLRALPLGGFVSFPDDDPESEYKPDDPNLLRNRPVRDRAIVTSAGVIANVIAAFAVCIVQAASVGITDLKYLPGVKLGIILPDTVADTAGLKKGDVVLQIEDMKVAPSPRAVQDVVDLIKENGGRTLHMNVDRGGKILGIDVKPAIVPDGSGRIGVQLGSNVQIERKHANGPLEAISFGTKEFVAMTNTVLSGLGQFVTNFKQTAQNVSGPVAIVAFGSEVARTDASGLFKFGALINLNLAVVNILPLPGLDGR